jgi:imidazole glycerol-phosphate synthase subunit HisF
VEEVEKWKKWKSKWKVESGKLEKYNRASAATSFDSSRGRPRRWLLASAGRQECESASCRESHLVVLHQLVVLFNFSTFQLFKLLFHFFHFSTFPLNCMLTKRIIACMDVRDGQVVKGVQFQQLRHAGDPAELARRYNVEGIDEVVVLDITATLETRQALARTINAVAREIFLPLTVGGGIRSEDDAAAAVDAGADKVSLNTAALRHPPLITTLARRYGSQAVIVAIDAKRRDNGFAVYVRSGTADASRDAVEWAREAESRGAGEILLTSMDRDGTRSGFDCDMTAAVAEAVNIPVIASGGAGGLDHFADVFTRGAADAALAASIFHYADTSVSELKKYLTRNGIPVRV